MADGDVIERRREARRRKILENSEDRLRKLASYDGKQQTNDAKQANDIARSEIKRDSHSNSNETANELERSEDYDDFEDDSDANKTRKSGNQSGSTDIKTLPKILSENKVVTKKIVDAKVDFVSSFQQKLILRPVLTWRKSIIVIVAILSVLSNYFLGESTLNKYVLMPMTTLETLILFAERLIEDGNRRRNQNDMIAAMVILLVGRKGVEFLNWYKVLARVLEDYAIFFFTYFMSHFWIDTIVC